MFSILELSLFQSDYFTNFNFKNGVIEAQSKNTGHWWQIFKMDMPRATMVVVRHRYPGTKKYHMQFHVHTFAKAYKMIVEHDSYILEEQSIV
jgi:hypothetical protein